MNRQFISCIYTSLSVIILSVLTACFAVRPSSGGGQGDVARERKINPADIALPAGYTIEAVASGLTFPTSVTFDDQGLVYVVEAGYSYGESWTIPRLLRIEPDGSASIISEGNGNGPWNGLTFYEGSFYVAEGGEREGGKILRISKSGEITALIDDLPSLGDHHTNGPVVHEGYIYFGQGTATNSGVVGEDNANFGWLQRHPDFHDIPCEDIVLRGVNYESDNPLSDDQGTVTTGAFVPFGTPTSEGQTIEGAVPCSGAVLKIQLSGGPAELVAWGFRNPFGLAVYEDQLFVVDNGYDMRGSRQVWGTGDVLWKVEEGKWYGWPDYSAGVPLTDNDFSLPDEGSPRMLLKEPPGPLAQAAAVLGVHSSSNGIDFPLSEQFGFSGHAFIAQFGDMAPNVGKVLGPVGFKLVAVDPDTGIITDFAVNKGNKNGPASWLKKGGLERPVAVKFHPDGKSLYVVDFGVVETSDESGVLSHRATGVVWKITKQE